MPALCVSDHWSSSVVVCRLVFIEAFTNNLSLYHDSQVTHTQIYIYMCVCDSRDHLPIYFNMFIDR